MNCLILVLLLLCCGNNDNCSDSNSGRERMNNDCGRERRNDDCGCSRERNNSGRSNNAGGSCGNDNSDDDGCDCRSDFRPEPRFEQRPFMFNQNVGCGREESQNNSCDR